MLEVTETAWTIDEQDTWKRFITRLEHGGLKRTSAPDTFHDLYGLLPFLVDLDYANFANILAMLPISRAIAISE